MSNPDLNPLNPDPAQAIRDEIINMRKLVAWGLELGKKNMVVDLWMLNEILKRVPEDK